MGWPSGDAAATDEPLALPAAARLLVPLAVPERLELELLPLDVLAAELLVVPAVRELPLDPVPVPAEEKLTLPLTSN